MLLVFSVCLTLSPGQMAATLPMYQVSASFRNIFFLKAVRQTERDRKELNFKGLTLNFTHMGMEEGEMFRDNSVSQDTKKKKVKF